MASEADAAAGAGAQGRVTQLEETLELMAETLRHGVVILEDYKIENQDSLWMNCLLYTSPSPRD